MKEEFNLSKKITGMKTFKEKDVKEFIKKVKEEFPVKEINGKLVKWHGKDIQMIIDRLAGKKLVQEVL